MSVPCIVMDIDGCLANGEDHVAAIYKDGKLDLDAFMSLYPQFKVNEEIKTLNNAMHEAGVKIFICTGRNEGTKYGTTKWLEAAGIKYDAIAFRRLADQRPDREVKKEMLDSIREGGFEPMFAVEDRACVTKMWRDNGVRCLQVCEGNY